MARLHKIPGVTDTSLTTNGTLLQFFAEELRESGMQRINISLDTLSPEKYRRITRVGDINTVLKGITAACTAGFNPIKINVVVLCGINDDEILSFAELTRERPVDVRFIEFMPVDTETGLNRGSFISNSDIRKEICKTGKLIQLSRPKNGGPAQMFRLEGAAGKLGFISPMSNHFCATCNRLRLTADGKLRTCLFSDSETNLKTPLRSGCSDAELQEIITEAILSKPARHTILDPSYKKCTRGMYAIGG